MCAWTKQRLDQMIADNVEENLALDYKRADSLAKTDGKKTEVTKDISSFANSSGGVVVYGIAEFDDEAKRHLPERLDPIQRGRISKEWLDQVIQTIRPRIEGIFIHPVPISEVNNTVCYVVEVPQSHTAHMARDHRYYKRQNFNVLPMEDYEVRDVMNRRGQPKLRVSIFVNRNTSEWNEGLILVKVENVSSTIAHDFMVDLEMPTDAGGEILVETLFLKKGTANASTPCAFGKI
jgi:predicted HTH transcriptional regulator